MIRTHFKKFKISDRKLIILILFLALMIRILYTVSLGKEISYPIRDQSYYLDLARNIASGKGLMLSREYWELRQSMINNIPELKKRFSNLEEWLKSTPWGIIKAGEPTSFCPPLYPIFLASIIKIFGENYIIIRLLQSFIGVALVYLVYLIGKLIFNTNIGLIAALICSFYPFFIYYTGYAMTETLNITLITLLIYLFYITVRNKSDLLPFLLGIVLAMTCLIRAMMFAFFLIIIILLLLEIPKGFKFKKSLYFFIGFTVLMTPWILRNYIIHGQIVIVPTTGGATMWMRNNPDVVIPEMRQAGFTVPEKVINNIRRRDLIKYPEFGDENEVERNKIITERVKEFIKANPLFFSYLCKNRFLWYMSFTGSTERTFWHKLIGFLTWGLILPLSLFGLLLAAIKGKFKDILIMVILMGFFAGVHTIVHGGIRYRLPTDPFFIILASFSIIYIWDWFSKSRISHE